jgi:hypothetical protein
MNFIFEYSKYATKAFIFSSATFYFPEAGPVTDVVLKEGSSDVAHLLIRNTVNCLLLLILYSPLSKGVTEE